MCICAFVLADYSIKLAVMYDIPYELNYYRFVSVNYIHILSIMIEVYGLNVMEEA